jgi:hypothetical protein
MPPLRPSIADTLKQLGNTLRTNAAQLATGAAQSWLEENREELMQVIAQAQTERGAALLHEFCQKVPLAAGVVTLAMKGTPEQAILAISVYSPSLGEQMKGHRKNIATLQEYWRRGAAQG